MAELGLPPPPKQHKGIFRGQQPPQPDISAFQGDISNLSRRLRILEEGFTNLRRALHLTEQNMLDKNKLFATEIKTIMSDMGDIKKEIYDMKEKMIEIAREFETTAKREDVKVLDRYINLWNPVKFVTQKEVQDIVKEMLEKRKTK